MLHADRGSRLPVFSDKPVALQCPALLNGALSEAHPSSPFLFVIKGIVAPAILTVSLNQSHPVVSGFCFLTMFHWLPLMPESQMNFAGEDYSCVKDIVIFQIKELRFININTGLGYLYFSYVKR